MANACLQLSGFLIGFVGWLGIVVATATDDWVTICKFGLTACKRLDELVARGPWAECLISTGRYHCLSLTQMLELPGSIITLLLPNSDTCCNDSHVLLYLFIYLSFLLCLSLHPDHASPDDHGVNPGSSRHGHDPDVHALHQPR